MASVDAGMREAPVTAKAYGSERVYGIDAGRTVCAFLVVLLHLAQFTGAGGVYNAPLQIICRLAVPFFFIASGYFLKVPDRVTATLVLRPVERIAPIYVFWALAYLAVFSLIFHAPTSLTLANVISGGRAFQLWFLPALLVASIAVPVAWIVVGRVATGIVAVLAAGAGIWLVSYKPDVPTTTIMFTRLLCAPFFVCLGVWLKQSGWRPSQGVAAAIVLAGLAGLVLEEVMLARVTGLALKSHDVLVSTYVYGLGMFLLFRALSATPPVGWLAARGRHSLGIYILHLFFIYPVLMLLPPRALGTLAVDAFIVFVLSYFASVTISRVAIMRRLVL